MPQRQDDPITLAAVGDVKPFREEPASIFRYCIDEFRSADILFGQMERVASEKGSRAERKVGGSRAPSNVVPAMGKAGAGFDVMSFAGNHSMDYGPDAFLDCLDNLRAHDVAVVGAGRDIEEARAPVIIERNGTKVGFLAYTSVFWTDLLVAAKDFPGCPPLRASTFYHQIDSQPGTPPLIVTVLDPEDKKAMEWDIKKLRPQVDVVVVAQHAGVHNIPEIIAMYQKEAAYAAVDAGADLVLQHHAHILKGVEVFKGKPIFYGLGNFATEQARDSKGKITSHMDPGQVWSRKVHFGIKAEKGFEKHHYHHDSLKTTIVKAYIQNKKIQKVTYVPTYINQNLEPEVITRKDPRAQEVFDYVVKISGSQDLKSSFSWDGDEVLVGE